jgi:signal transduction histidine kinase
VKLSIRTRLALLYGGVFFAMGLVLMVISYAIVDHALSPPVASGTVARYVNRTVANQGFGQDVLQKPVAIGSDTPKAIPPGSMQVVIIGSAQGFASGGSPGVGLEDLLANFQEQTLQEILWRWAAVVALMTIAAGAFGWVLAGRMLKPLRDITGAARELSVANLHERIALEGPRDELKELGDTFDGMLGRLETAFASQRRFVANASHELRTPLAIMRAQIDVALSEPGVTRTELVATSRVVRDAVDRCERLLDGLLVLARSDRGLEAAEQVDLAGSAERALDLVSAAAAERGIELRSSLGAAPVRGDPALLDRLVANLVENAVAYNGPSGWVEVTTKNGGPTASVRVTNSGPRVPPERLPYLFEPFQRLSRERTDSGRGAGLGLSIVRSVARAHGGEVSARARTEGGLAVEVELPVPA